MKPIYTLLIVTLLSSCVLKMKTIESGEVGIKKKFGKINSNEKQPGLKLYSLGTKILTFNTKVHKLTVEKFSSRTNDDVNINPHVALYVKVKPEMAAELIQNYAALKTNTYGYTSEERRNFTPLSFKTYLSNRLENAIALSLSNVESFTLLNQNRSNLAISIQNNLTGDIFNYFTIERLEVTEIKVDKILANTMNENGVLQQKIDNNQLKIQLAQQQLVLDSLKSISQKTNNEVLEPSLSEKTLERMRIENGINGNPGNNVIINQ